MYPTSPRQSLSMERDVICFIIPPHTPGFWSKRSGPTSFFYPVCVFLSPSILFLVFSPCLPLFFPFSFSLTFPPLFPFLPVILILLFFFFIFLPSFPLFFLSSNKFFIVVYNKGDPMSWFARSALGYASCPHVITLSIFTVKILWVWIINYIVMLSDPYKEKWEKHKCITQWIIPR